MVDSAQDPPGSRAQATFVTTPLDDLLGGATPQAGAEAAFALFRRVLAGVPAYARFLAEQGVDPAAVTGPAEWSALPFATKENYLRRHRLAELCRGGRLEACDVVAVSSGSTGTPTFWPRALADEFAVAERFEQVFHDAFEADRRRTLVVVCFALGTWVGGLFTLACCRHLAAKGYPLTVVAPGNDPGEIFRVLEALGPEYEQTVLAGYPPFVKDVVDAGRARGIDWAALAPRFLFAGEVFSEEWRALLHQRAGVRDACAGSASLYGTADAGVLGAETPISVLVRRWLAGRPEVARALFGESRLPTLVQYDPRRRYFETVEGGTLAFSGDNGVPLVRYHIGDEGGLFGFEELLARLREQGFDALQAAREAGLRRVREQPFVYVFGRSHFVLSWYGANLYPENLAVGLEQPEVREFVTGKFVMLVAGPPDDQALEVHVELAPGEQAEPGRAEAVGRCLLRELRRLNSEFAHYVPEARQPPRVRLHPRGDAEWFPPGVKHRYSRR